MRNESEDPRWIEAHSAIAARSREFELHFAERDARRLVAEYFAEDTHQPLASPPGGVPPVRGCVALVKMFTAQFERVRAIRLETVGLEVSDEIAYELGVAHLELANGDTATGRYTVLWRKRRGEWRAQMDFFAEDGWIS